MDPLKQNIVNDDSYQDSQWLDASFDQLLLDLKPHVLSLPHKNDRQKVALWIRKLCGTQGAGTLLRRNRNKYAQLLLHMLKRGVVEGPFMARPDHRPLEPLPSYMSVYFDDKALRKSSRQERSDVRAPVTPDWLAGELMDTTLSSPNTTSTHRDSSHYYQQHSREPLMSNGDSFHHSFNGEGANEHHANYIKAHSTPLYYNDQQENGGWLQRSQSLRRVRSLDRVAPDNPPMVEDQQHTPHTKPHDYRQAGIQNKILENKMYEEKLKLQRQHDDHVQKILDRKNSEIEEVKRYYKSKMEEMEAIIRKLEHRLDTVVKESQVMAECKNKEVEEFKMLTHKQSDTVISECERKLNELSQHADREKHEIQQAHTRSIEQLVEDTNTRLARMDSDHHTQQTDASKVMKEMEVKLKLCESEAAELRSSVSSLNVEKKDLELHYSAVNTELQECRKKLTHQDTELKTRTEELTADVRQTRSKMEANMEIMQQEHQLSASKSTEVISDLQQQLSEMKMAVEDSEHTRHRQLREQESLQQQDKLHAEHAHERKVRSVQSEFECERSELNRRIQKLEQTIRDKTDQLDKAVDLHKQTTEQSEKSFTQFKSQVETEAQKTYTDMNTQMEQVEADLKKSKSLREKQAREFARELDDERKRAEKEIAALRCEYEQERSVSRQQTQTDRDTLKRDHEEHTQQLTQRHEGELKESEKRARDHVRQRDKRISELEQEVRNHKEEVIQANTLRKQQLVELGLLREEERGQAARDHDTHITKLRTESEQERATQQQQLATELDKTCQEASQRLRKCEKDFNMKLSKAAETIAELKMEIETQKEHNTKEKRDGQTRESDKEKKHEDNLKKLKKQSSTAVKMLQHELELQKNEKRLLEKQLHSQENESQERMNELMLEYTDKMRGLMPTVVRLELEDTITSLKAQVVTLEQRCDILQDEVSFHGNGPTAFRLTPPTKLRSN